MHTKTTAVEMTKQTQRTLRDRLAWFFLIVGGIGITSALIFWLADNRSAAAIAAPIGMSALALAINTSRRFISLSFTGWVLASGTWAMFHPNLFIKWGDFELKSTFGPLIQLILFGMGMTLTFEDFARVIKLPKAVLIGIICQFAIMPFAGFAFAKFFGLEPQVAAGLILVGSCPGGVTSNIIAYIARANVALSVTMTACSTLVSPIMTPLAMKTLAGQYVPIEVLPMMISILKIIIAPLIIGVLANRYAHKYVQKVIRGLPPIAMFGTCAIITVTIALARDDMFRVALGLFGASVCHNATGYLLGYFGARFSGLEKRDSRTVAIEVGIQNGGMATTLAMNVMGKPLAALGSAIFGPWSAVTSSALASYWRRSTQAEETQRPDPEP